MDEKRDLTTDKHRFTQIPDLDQLNLITEKIIGCAYTVSNILGAGFLEKVYENALAHELRKAGLKVQQQHPLHVNYGWNHRWRLRGGSTCRRVCFG